MVNTLNDFDYTSIQILDILLLLPDQNFLHFFLITVLCCRFAPIALSTVEAPSVERDSNRDRRMDTPALEINEASAEDRALTESFCILRYADPNILSFSKPSLDRLEVDHQSSFVMTQRFK